jgi:hypothetical protein
MSKLSLDALKERAEATASNELLDTISGGTANSCHQQSGGFWGTVSSWFSSIADFNTGIGGVGRIH